MFPCSKEHWVRAYLPRYYLKDLKETVDCGISNCSLHTGFCPTSNFHIFFRDSPPPKLKKIAFHMSCNFECDLIIIPAPFDLSIVQT